MKLTQIAPILGLGLLALASDDPAVKKEADFKKMVKTLEERVAKLESRVQVLEQRTPVILQTNLNWHLPRTANEVPRQWQEREFNGMKYYLVPLDQR